MGAKRYVRTTLYVHCGCTVTVPAARTRGPEAQCRALGFHVYHQWTPAASSCIVVSRGGRTYHYNTRFLQRGAAWFLDDYVRRSANTVYV